MTWLYVTTSGFVNLYVMAWSIVLVMQLSVMTLKLLASYRSLLCCGGICGGSSLRQDFFRHFGSAYRVKVMTCNPNL
jgi:hypothetical protein